MFQTEVVTRATWLTVKVPADPPEMQDCRGESRSWELWRTRGYVLGKGAGGILSDVCSSQWQEHKMQTKQKHEKVSESMSEKERVSWMT